jgi:hypothetical protein
MIDRRALLGPVGLAKLEPALRGTPVVESQHHARVFAPVLEPKSRTTTFNNLPIYETNTSNQSQSAHGISVNRSQLSADSGRNNHWRSKDREADRFPQTKQRFYRHRNGPRLRGGILSIHDYCPDFSLANLLEHCRNCPDGAGLLTGISSQ